MHIDNESVGGRFRAAVDGQSNDLRDLSRGDCSSMALRKGGGIKMLETFLGEQISEPGQV